ncbi:hypothetical protein ABT275_39405 [Streptomyces sp. NPDC001185]|uniref:hypothetical protein n=1 Tax=Streptomyces sp. NPDC001185 TaxID=3154380 RepID=UPI00331FB7B7
MVDSSFTEREGVPSAEQSYRGAPDVLSEAAALSRLAEFMLVEAKISALREETAETDFPQERLYLLRRAALSDRLALEYPEVEQFVVEALKTADRLVEFDRARGSHRGPAEPGARIWANYHRGYVRQEYFYREKIDKIK